MVIGHVQQKERISSLINNNRINNFSLVGKSYIGKKSLLLEILNESVDESNIFISDTSIGSIREAREFLSSSSLFGGNKFVVINDAENLSEPAQDALLKIVEEPIGGSKIIFITSDFDSFLPALKNRLHEIVYFLPLSEDEMNEFIKSTHQPRKTEVIGCSQGRPGLYLHMISNNYYLNLLKILNQIIENREKALHFPVPEIISKTKSGKSIERDSISSVCSYFIHSKLGEVGSDSLHRLSMFSSVIVGQPSSNIEIYWYRFIFSLL